MELIAQNGDRRTVPGMTATPAYHRPHLTPRAPAVTTLWEEWLFSVVRSGCAITRVRVVRVSSSSRAIFIANLTASLAVADHRDPDVRRAQELGVAVVENSQEGDEVRAETGTYHLRLASLPGGSHSQKHLGYAVPVGNTLFVYLMGSAAEGNLRTSANQEDWLNAATEAIRIAVRVLAPQLDERLSVHWSEETRVARSDQAAADILTTLRKYDVRLLLRDVEYDLKDQGQVIRLLLGMAAAERDSMVDRTTRGKASLLAVHRLPEAKGSTAPWTHGPGYRTFTDRRGTVQTVQEDHELTVRPGADAALAPIVRRIITVGEAALATQRPIPWTSVAVWASKRFGLTSRMPADIKANPDGLPLTELVNPGSALRRLFSQRYITAWRTGLMPWEMAFPAENAAVRLLTDTGRQSTKGAVIYAGEVECPVPPGGWGLSTDEWDRLERVLAPRSPLSGRTFGDWLSPFTSADSWTSDAEHRWIDSTGTAVRLRSRPIESQRASLASVPGHVLGGCRALTLYRSISQAIAGAVTGLVAGELVLHADPSPDGDTDLALRRSELEAAIESSEKTLRQARLQKDAFRASAAAATERGDEADAVAYGEMATGQQEVLERAEAELAKHQRALASALAAPSSTTKEQISFKRVEQIAAGLAHDWGRDTCLPAALAEGVRLLFRGSFRMESGRSQMRWSGTLHVPLAAGGLATVDVRGEVPTSTRRSAANTGRNALTLLEMRLAEDAPFDELGTAWGIDGRGQKNSQLHRLLVTALREGVDGRCVPTDLAIRILLYSAPREVRAAMWSYLMGEPAASPWEAHIRRTYSTADFVFGETWVGRDHSRQRLAMDLLLRVGDPATGLPLLDAAEHLGLNYRQTCTELTYHLRAGKVSQPPPFTTNWTRTSATPIEERKVLAHPCTNPACRARGGGAGGRRMREAVVLATHVLWTPETPSGVLCPACRQAPGMPRIVFPETYLRSWNRVGRIHVSA